MVTITLYTKQKKRHRCIEQTFGLCGRRRGWDVSIEWLFKANIVDSEGARIFCNLISYINFMYFIVYNMVYVSCVLRCAYYGI